MVGLRLSLEGEMLKPEPVDVARLGGFSLGLLMLAVVSTGPGYNDVPGTGVSYQVGGSWVACPCIGSIACPSGDVPCRDL